MSGDPDIARIELMDWYDEKRERAYTARFSPADMEKETTMSENTPLPRGPFEEPSNAIEPPDLKAELGQAVRALAAWRGEAAEAKETAIALEAEMLASEIGVRVQRAKEWAKAFADTVQKTENDVRRLALNIFQVNGEKKPHGAVTIKRYNTPRILAETLLLEHVRIHVPQCVKLDKRQVTKLARAGLEMPWVEFEEEYRATIATKLDKWLPKEEPSLTVDEVPVTVEMASEDMPVIPF